MRHKPKVLIFESSKNWGGIESYIDNELSPLHDEFDLYLMAQSNDPAILSRLSGCGIDPDHIIVVQDSAMSGGYKRRLREVLRTGFDIAYFNKNSLVKFMPIRWVRKYSNARVVIHSHNTRPSRTSPLGILHYVLRPFVIAMADSRLACSVVAGRYMFGPRKSFEVISNGIDTDRFTFELQARTKYRAKLGVDENTKLLINVGRFGAQKNQEYLIRIFADYNRANPDSVLLLVGPENGLKPQLEALATELCVAGKVRFMGARDDVAHWYCAADVAVYPSLYEGLPVTFIEAQCTGLPLVASTAVTREADISGIMDFVPLDGPIERWSQAIANAVRQGATISRSESAEKVREQGYDRKTSIVMLRSILHNLVQAKR